eukprot:TRINITY_DN81097_c0_g1_i1.p1 TRINITY_DN81097_c0_g1~~TRINITY_DN81097_c0_g1_i1.p1  ORF type:complete len:236 (+),score=55.46 TRINITY_DN81097_c0_g1_i1:32-739(+)
MLGRPSALTAVLVIFSALPCDADSGQVGTGALSSLLLPAFLKELRLPAAAEDIDLVSPCIGSKLSEDMLMANLTRVSELLSGRLSSDPLLDMRAALRRLFASLAVLAGNARTCGVVQDSTWEGLQSAVHLLGDLVNAGRLNDGFCPFKRTRQTSIGGAEVGSQLRRLGSLELTDVMSDGGLLDEVKGKKVRKAAKQVGKVLRKVQEDGSGPDPAGTTPVNWEMRVAMFGGRSDEL